MNLIPSISRLGVTPPSLLPLLYSLGEIGPAVGKEGAGVSSEGEDAFEEGNGRSVRFVSVSFGRTAFVEVVAVNTAPKAVGYPAVDLVADSANDPRRGLDDALIVPFLSTLPPPPPPVAE